MTQIICLLVWLRFSNILIILPIVSILFFEPTK
jgi:hypothetical protein